MRMDKTPLVALFLLLSLSGAVGCSSDDDDASVCIGFSTTETPQAGRVVARPGAGSSCGTAEVELVVTGVTDIYAFGATLVYEANLVTFVGIEEEGSLLISDGVEVIPLTGGSTGSIEISVSRKLDAANPDSETGIDAVAGNDLLIRLLFAPRAGGTATLAFENTELLGSEQPPVSKPGITWVGGSLTVR
jgi:hypothetical protein